MLLFLSLSVKLCTYEICHLAKYAKLGVMTAIVMHISVGTLLVYLICHATLSNAAREFTHFVTEARMIIHVSS